MGPSRFALCAVDGEARSDGDVKKGNVHFILYVVAGGQQFTPDATQQLVINLAANVIARL